MLRTPFACLAALTLAACGGGSASPALTIDPVAPKTDADLQLRFASLWVTLGAPPPAVTVAWTRDGVPVPEFQDLDIIPATETTRGQTWAATMTRLDGVGVPLVASVVIANSPPVGSTAEVHAAEDLEDGGEPANPPLTVAPDTRLACLAGDSTDADLDPVVPMYAWTVDGEILDGEVGEFLGAGHVVAGVSVGCIVTPSDGVDYGEPIRSAQVQVEGGDSGDSDVDTGDTDVEVNRPPVIDSLALVARSEDGDLYPDGVAFADSVLEVEFETHDPDDGDSLSTSVVWQINGTPLADFSGMELRDLFLKNDEVSVAVNVCDDQAPPACVSADSDPLTIQNSAPYAGSPTIKESAAGVAGMLSCIPPEDSGDADDDRVTWQYRWTVDSELVAAVDESLNVAKVELSDGKVVRKDMPVYCAVAPFDGTDSGLWKESEKLAIANTPPTGDTPTVKVVDPATSLVSTGSVFRRSVVECVTGRFSDIDSDPEQWHYQWFVGTTPVPSASSYRLHLDGVTGVARGAKITCRAAPYDGTDEGAWKTSAEREVANSPPSAPVVELTPADPAPHDALVCSVVGASTDADADALTYTFSWTRDGSAYTRATPTTAGWSSTVASGVTKEAETWTCAATASDGWGGSAVSATVSTTVSLASETLCAAGFAGPEEGSRSGGHASLALCDFEGADGAQEAVFSVAEGTTSSFYFRSGGTSGWATSSALATGVGIGAMGVCSVDRAGSDSAFYYVDPANAQVGRIVSIGVTSTTREYGQPDGMALMYTAATSRPRLLLRVLRDPSSPWSGRCWKYREWTGESLGATTSCIGDFDPPHPTRVFGADLDGDGTDELVYSEEKKVKVAEIGSAGSGLRATSVENLDAGCDSAITELRVFDLDGDGIPDVHVVCGSEVITLFGDGDTGVWAECANPLPTNACGTTSAYEGTVGSVAKCSAWAPSDRDGDGYLDLVGTYATDRGATVRHVWRRALAPMYDASAK